MFPSTPTPTKQATDEEWRARRSTAAISRIKQRSLSPAVTDSLPGLSFGSVIPAVDRTASSSAMRWMKEEVLGEHSEVSAPGEQREVWQPPPVPSDTALLPRAPTLPPAPRPIQTQTILVQTDRMVPVFQPTRDCKDKASALAFDAKVKREVQAFPHVESVKDYSAMFPLTESIALWAKNQSLVFPPGSYDLSIHENLYRLFVDSSGIRDFKQRSVEDIKQAMHVICSEYDDFDFPSYNQVVTVARWIISTAAQDPIVRHTYERENTFAPKARSRPIQAALFEMILDRLPLVVHQDWEVAYRDKETPTIDCFSEKLVEFLCQHQAHIQMTLETEGNGRLRRQTAKPRRTDKIVKCSKCQRSGHTAETCFAKTPTPAKPAPSFHPRPKAAVEAPPPVAAATVKPAVAPPVFRPTPRPPQAPMQAQTASAAPTGARNCHICGSASHLRRECPQKDKQKPKKKQVAAIAVAEESD